MENLDLVIEQDDLIYAKGVTVKEIIATLTAHGILYKGRQFPMNTVYGILRNEKYSGTYMHGDEVVDKIYPPNETHIYFNNPLQTDPDVSQGFSVCDRETTIPAHIQNSYELRRKNIRLTITI